MNFGFKKILWWLLEEYKTFSYTEKNYSISINSVKEKDLVIPDLEEYKIEESINNVDEEYIELYKNLI